MTLPRVLSRWFLIVMIALAGCLSSVVRADALEGTYKLAATGATTTLTVNGQRLKPCAEDGKRYLDMNRTLIVQYDGSSAFVNNSKWVFASNDNGQVVAKRPADRTASNIEIWFRVVKGVAQGMLIYANKDSDNHLVCATAQPLKGTHTR